MANITHKVLTDGLGTDYVEINDQRPGFNDTYYVNLCSKVQVSQTTPTTYSIHVDGKQLFNGTFADTDATFPGNTFAQIFAFYNNLTCSSAVVVTGFEDLLSSVQNIESDVDNINTITTGQATIYNNLTLFSNNYNALAEVTIPSFDVRGYKLMNSNVLASQKMFVRLRNSVTSQAYIFIMDAGRVIIESKDLPIIMPGIDRIALSRNINFTFVGLPFTLPLFVELYS